jgi:phosphohistidine phosphatase SixA
MDDSSSNAFWRDGFVLGGLALWLTLKRGGPFISKITLLGFFFVVAGPLAACTTLFPAQEKSIDTKIERKALVRALQEGGYVIYFRHAATDRSQKDLTPVNFSSCATQRNLSEQGREQSRTVGQAFRALGINVATVMTSPFCRCLDMGKLAFGAVTVSEGLLFSIHKDQQETERLAATLRTLLGTVPQDGGNTVLISHSVNLKEAARIDPKTEGEAHIFRPHGDGRFSHIAQIGPQEWVALVNLK